MRRTGPDLRTTEVRSRSWFKRRPTLDEMSQYQEYLRAAGYDLTDEDVARFLAQAPLNEAGHRLWQRSVALTSKPMFRVKGRAYLARRLMWIVDGRPLPHGPATVVRGHCGWRLCLASDHSFATGQSHNFPTFESDQFGQLRRLDPNWRPNRAPS